MSVRVNERMKCLIDRRAKESKMSLSEYIKHAVLVDSMIDGDIEAMQIIAGNMKHKLQETALKMAGAL